MLAIDLRDLLAPAQRALDVALKTLRDADGPGQFTAKGDRDYATSLDYEIEHRVREHLAAETPEVGFLGEEEGATGNAGGPRWVLDPIDGTVNFAHGLPLYAISLALVVGDQPVLGVIDLPAFGHRYHAADGLGAFKDGERLPCPAGPSGLSDAVVAIGDYSVGREAEAKNRERLQLTASLAASALRVRMLGTAAIDLSWLAEGHLDALVTFSNNTWDMAAGVVLARQTGHSLADRTGQPYSIWSDSIIAADASLVPDLVRMC